MTRDELHALLDAGFEVDAILKQTRHGLFQLTIRMPGWHNVTRVYEVVPAGRFQAETVGTYASVAHARAAIDARLEELDRAATAVPTCTPANADRAASCGDRGAA